MQSHKRIYNSRVLGPLRWSAAVLKRVILKHTEVGTCCRRARVTCRSLSQHRCKRYSVVHTTGSKENEWESRSCGWTRAAAGFGCQCEQLSVYSNSLEMHDCIRQSTGSPAHTHSYRGRWSGSIRYGRRTGGLLVKDFTNIFHYLHCDAFFGIFIFFKDTKL